jgi:23S rRNA-/tRNA-specific pseudouridylate synthase
LFKVSHNVKAGDKVNCVISELQPLRAEPENIPLDIVYEDENVLVVNKPAHMVISLHNFKKVETFGIEMLML